MTKPIEGWILAQQAQGHIIYWKVSGYTHPEARAIAVPYRLGTARVSPAELIPAASPEYLPCIGRRAYTVDLNRAYWINPDRILKYRLRDLKASRPRIMELLETLNPEWAGLTGSWATLHDTPQSDVDLLAYEGDGWSLYRSLKDLKEEGKIAWCPGKHHASLPRLHGYQLLDACYMGERYTIRILETLEARGCMGTIISLGWVESALEIVEPVAPHRVPSKYKAKMPGWGEVTLETWHTRYQELAPGYYRARLQIFEARGGTIASPDLGGWIRVARVNAANLRR